MSVKVVLSPDIQGRLILALTKAGNREIGGILMGEHTETDTFRVVDLTVQKSHGTVLSFLRLLDGFADALRTFFSKTHRQYTRFNYLGEWHSHPLFTLSPSNKDIQSMLEIVNDEQVGANFIVLLIVRLNSSDAIQGTVTAFFAKSAPVSCDLVLETHNRHLSPEGA